MPSNDLPGRAANIIDSLAIAFGGISRVPLDMIGLAIANQVKNNGLGCYYRTNVLCDRIMRVYFDRAGRHDDYRENDRDISTVTNATKAAMRTFGINPDSLPLPRV